MIRFTPALALIAMSACTTVTDLRERFGGGDPMPAADVGPVLSAKERFVAAAETQNCVVNPETVNTIMADATVSIDEMGSIVTELEAEGRAVPEGDLSLRVISDNCPK